MLRTGVGWLGSVHAAPLVYDGGGGHASEAPAAGRRGNSQKPNRPTRIHRMRTAGNLLKRAPPAMARPASGRRRRVGKGSWFRIPFVAAGKAQDYQGVPMQCFGVLERELFIPLSQLGKPAAPPPVRRPGRADADPGPRRLTRGAPSAKPWGERPDGDMYAGPRRCPSAARRRGKGGPSPRRLAVNPTM